MQKFGISRVSHGREAWQLLLLSMVYFLALVGVRSSRAASEEEQQLDSISAIIKNFRNKLGIADSVSPLLVEANEYLVSVERGSSAPKGFTIKFERKFLSTLDTEELRAVIAHELGHVWIFTHHPYLQTEALANEKARLVVSKDSLERVYKKVWEKEGQKGTLEEFLAKVE